MIKWTDNSKGQTRSVPEAVKLFTRHIRSIDPTFDLKLLNEVKFSKAAPSTLTDENGIHAWAKYGPFVRGSGPGGEYRWSDIVGPDKWISIPVDAKVFESDEAIVGIIGHELHELNAIRDKIENSPNKSISAKELKRIINESHNSAIRLQNRAVIHVRESNAN